MYLDVFIDVFSHATNIALGAPESRMAHLCFLGMVECLMVQDNLKFQLLG